MPAYWNHFMSHVSTQRARWTRTPPNSSSSSSSSEHASLEEQVDDSFVAVQLPTHSSNSDIECDLKRENESLKREITELNDIMSQLRQLLDARAEQIQVLVVGMRHLRLQQRRWSSLSSVDSFPDLDSGEVHSLGRLYNLCDLGSSDEDEDTTNEFSESFDGWSESDEEEKDEEPGLSILAPLSLKNTHSKTVNQQRRSPIRSHTQ